MRHFCSIIAKMSHVIFTPPMFPAAWTCNLTKGHHAPCMVDLRGMAVVKVPGDGISGGAE